MLLSLCLAAIPMIAQNGLPAKADLGDNKLSSPLKINTAGVSIKSIAKGNDFTPSDLTGYTVEMKAKCVAAMESGLNMRMNTGTGFGFVYSVYPTQLQDFSKKVLANLTDNKEEHTYRVAVSEGRAYYYRDGVLVGYEFTDRINSSSTNPGESDNLLTDGSFENAVINPGDDWATIPAGRIGSGRYSRVDNTDNWASSGSKYLFVRMRDGDDSGLSCQVLYYKVKGLTPGAGYKFSFKYKGHKDFSGKMKVMALTDYNDYTDENKALGKIVSTTAETVGNSGSSSPIKSLNMEFMQPNNQTETYLVFIKDGPANYYLDDLSLKVDYLPTDFIPELAVGKFEEGASDMEITTVHYDLTGAYAPVSGNENCFTPLEKDNLITDPCFDYGFEPSNKTAYSSSLGIYSGDAGASVEMIKANVYCGTLCGKVVGTGKISLAFDGLTSFTKYKFHAKIRSNEKGEFVLAAFGSNGNVIAEKAATGEWADAQIEFTSDLTGKAELAFYGKTAEGEGWTDNWELYAGEAGSVTEGTITADMLSEKQMKSTIVDILARNMEYAATQHKTEGYFGNGQNTEHGARTNADYAFICALLVKYGQSATYPAGITPDKVKEMAVKAVEYSYNTHKTGTKNCTNNAKWGLCWESSMWSASLAYAGWLLNDVLTDAQKEKIRKVVVAEANYNLQRYIPTNVNSDTKAEENGWDTNILAIAAAMYSDEPNADAWHYRCRQFGMNTYSIAADAHKHDVVDGKKVRDWFVGANLYDDYALENHDFFHTSYLNIEIQELSESYLAYKVMQNKENPSYDMPDALRHNVSGVWNELLKDLALADGELAMPNGNDWSMYLYDQLASYAAMATIYKDPDALMLENLALKYTQARQHTTTNGAFMLKSDVGERRMGVTGRRLAFTYLYHEFFPLEVQATTWSEFSKKHEKTKFLPFSQIIRSNTDKRFTTFSWFQSNNGNYKSYMGMIAPNSTDMCKITFPYRKGNSGNFTGYFDASGKNNNAALVSTSYAMYPNCYSTNGILSVNDGNMKQYIAYYSTPGNAVIYLDEVVGAVSGTVTGERGLLQGVTTDVFTKQNRKVYGEGGVQSGDGSSLMKISGNWANIDNVFGMVVNGGNGIAFGEREEVKSVMVSKLYGSYSTGSRAFSSGDVIASRSGIFYSLLDAETTKAMAAVAQYPTVPKGWKATVAQDPDGSRYMLLSNFYGTEAATVELTFEEGAPVFDRVTTINGKKGNATFTAVGNSSLPQMLYCFVSSSANGLQAVQVDGNARAVYLKNNSSASISATVTIINGQRCSGSLIVEAGKCVLASLAENIVVSKEAEFPANYRDVLFGKSIKASSQWPENMPFASIDGDEKTYWKSMIAPVSKSNNQWVVARLLNNYSIDKVVLTATDKGYPASVSVLVSNDDISYKSVATQTLESTVEAQIISFEKTDARYVKIVFNSTIGKTPVTVKCLKIMGEPVIGE